MKIRIKAFQDDIAISAFNEIGSYLDKLPKTVIKKWRKNCKKYAGMAGKDYNDLWEGIEKYKY